MTDPPAGVREGLSLPMAVGRARSRVGRRHKPRAAAAVAAARILRGPGLQTLSPGSHSGPLKVKYKAVGEEGFLLNCPL